MNWYKKAELDLSNLDKIDPEMRDLSIEDRKLWLNPSLRERIIEKFKVAHPNMTVGIKEILEWYRKNFTNKAKEFNWSERDTDFKG